MTLAGWTVLLLMLLALLLRLHRLDTPLHLIPMGRLCQSVLKAPETLTMSCPQPTLFDDLAREMAEVKHSVEYLSMREAQRAQAEASVSEQCPISFPTPTVAPTAPAAQTSNLLLQSLHQPTLVHITTHAGSF